MHKFNVFKNNEKVFSSNNCKDCNDYISSSLEDDELNYSSSPYWIEDEEENDLNKKLKEEIFGAY